MSFDSCSSEGYQRDMFKEAWTSKADLALEKRLKNDPLGNKKMQFVKDWPSGEASFSTMEWATLITNGAMTQHD